MSIDFEVPAEAKAIREKVRKWVQEECIPAEKELDTKPLKLVGEFTEKNSPTKMFHRPDGSMTNW